VVLEEGAGDEEERVDVEVGVTVGVDSPFELDTDGINGMELAETDGSNGEELTDAEGINGSELPDIDGVGYFAEVSLTDFVGSGGIAVDGESEGTGMIAVLLPAPSTNRQQTKTVSTTV
jgi:hypothetical protein